MNTVSIFIGGALGLLLAVFVLRLSYVILINLINGRKFHHALQQEFDNLRLSNMLTALGINKTDYIYQNSVKDIHQQMKSCSDCENKEVCDEKLASPELDISEIDFCNNEAELKIIKQNQSLNQLR